MSLHLHAVSDYNCYSSVTEMLYSLGWPTLESRRYISRLTQLYKIMHNHTNNSKNPGPDGWPIPIIKSVSEFIAIPLSIIFKKSFNSGILPHDWKNAQVTPIHKKCARNQVCNYRPVSLTSIFSKFMESIVKDHLMSHLLANNLLSDYQFGFIPGRSCTTQLLYILVLNI